MGEYADMIIEGFIDQFTGEVIDGDSPGYPRSKKKKTRKTRGWNSRKNRGGSFACDQCKRKFHSAVSVEQHKRDAHGAEK